MSIFDADRSWEQTGVVSLWLGDFASAEEFEDYFAEQIGDDDQTPINRFAAETGLNFYDIGFQEADFNEAGQLDVSEFLKRFSYSSSFIEEAAQAARAAGHERANTIVLLYNCDYKRVAQKPGELDFIGSFPYDQTAPPAGQTS